MLGHRAVDSFLHGFAKNTLAELLFQQRHRHFTLAEAFHFDFWARFFELFVHFRVELCGWDGDGIASLETFV